jgi:hypothetical protein
MFLAGDRGQPEEQTERDPAAEFRVEEAVILVLSIVCLSAVVRWDWPKRGWKLGRRTGYSVGVLAFFAVVMLFFIREPSHGTALRDGDVGQAGSHAAMAWV